MPDLKRSQVVSLALLLGAGATAYGLARRDPSQREEDTLVYRDVATCLGQGLRSRDDCEAADREARALYPRVAPRYDTNAACEAHHGCGGCTAGGFVATEAAGHFIPLLSGFMIGRTAEQAIPVQPLFRHETRPCGGGGGFAGSYCTSSGGRIWTSGSGSSSARVSSAVARTAATTPRVVASGGFGGTGRAVAGGHGGGSGGGGA
ncbi:integral membrane protein-like protein [Methylobacterium sp. 4-46]|uniref:DUF1190 domain-containing protein n=1 Tax=Methylobacterium sp. (strain 4-46) TaxID=426117 RepID=UPI000152D67F|nr:DUF1190 domain-containing protein [Methylobacterium sp. 4-46]ACA19720.1 integral membrane protein-like protein [Methylobacterium sp. 4-46]